jgi:hypothetical protein
MKLLILIGALLFTLNTEATVDVEWIGSNSNGQLLHITVDNKRYVFEVKDEHLTKGNVKNIVDSVVETVNSTERRRVFKKDKVH